jgi:DnaJ-class molecular chaperone
MSFDNPYEILGCKDTDSIDHIETVYKGYVKLLHPDKANTPESKRLGMSRDEKIQYLNLVIGAFKTIKSVHKNNEYPDYNMVYNVGQDNTIKLNNKLTKEDAKNFSNSKFNDIFSESLQKDKESGMQDPYSRGYNNFDQGKDFSENNNGKIGMQTYSGDISVVESKNVRKHKMKDNRLKEYVPSTTVFSGSSENYQELGLTDISDFSMTIEGKGSINGTDLMSVYGKNLEPWEVTFKRDSNAFSKFTDNQDVKTKAAQIQTDRGDIYNQPIDRKMLDKEKRYVERQDRKELSRKTNLNIRDEYYNNLNMGRLGDDGKSLPNRS